MWPCIITNFFVIKPTRHTNFTNLFCHDTLHVSDSFWAGAYAPARKLSTNLYDIYHCWVYSEWTPDDGQTNCSKHVEFRDKVNLWN
jgi:hypothetical protein